MGEGKFWGEYIAYVVQGRVRNGISIGKNVNLEKYCQYQKSKLSITYLSSFQVDEHMVVIMYRMRVSMRVATSTLIIFSTSETSIYIEIECRYRAYFLKVEIKDCSIYLEFQISV